MSKQALKITIGGLIILGGYIFAYKYGYVKGLLDFQLAFEEDDRKRRAERPRRGYSEYYHRSITPREEKYILNSRSEAEEVLTGLKSILKTYGLVTVADYKDLIAVPATFHDNKRGWTDISSAEIIGSFHWWTVVLPEPTKLN